MRVNNAIMKLGYTVCSLLNKRDIVGDMDENDATENLNLRTNSHCQPVSL